MEINRCYGCMSELTAYPCEKCGYDPEKQKSPDYALRPGAILNGKYLIGRVLGQGGFGITYVGWDLALERKVAIKEYFPSGQVSRYPGTTALQWYSTEQSGFARQSGLEMFLKEARKMSRVDEISGVVGVCDLFQENDTAYIVMKFIEGETLKSRLQKTGPLSWEEAKKIFFPVIHSMEDVHRRGLIHRDLSPDNLMLTPEGTVKILDLGAAKDLNVNSGASSMQVAKGGFSPLEQYIQRGGSGTWTDVYAIAATMYYTLTGVLPLTAIDRMDKDTLRWDLPQLQTLPQNVVSALKQAMVLRAEDRTQTMEAFSAQLISPEKYDGKKRNKERKQKDSGKRRKRFAIAAVAVFAAVVVGTVAYRMQPSVRYERACALMDNGDYQRAYRVFASLGSYQDSEEQAANMGIEAALAMSREELHGDAIALINDLPEGDRVTRVKNNINLSWVSNMIQQEAYQDALDKLDELNLNTQEAVKLRKKANYCLAKYVSTEYVDIYNHYAAAGDYADAEDARRATLEQWIGNTLDNIDLTQARTFRDHAILDASDAGIVYNMLCDKTMYHKSASGSWEYTNHDLQVRKALLEALPGNSAEQDGLKKVFNQLTNLDDNDVFVKNHLDLVKSLWHLPVVRDIATASWAVYPTLWGQWSAKKGDYIEFTETSFKTSLPCKDEPKGTLYYNIERVDDYDSELVLYWSNDSGNLTDVFRFQMLEPDVMTVYCSRGGSTYELTRK